MGLLVLSALPCRSGCVRCPVRQVMLHELGMGDVRHARSHLSIVLIEGVAVALLRWVSHLLASLLLWHGGTSSQRLSGSHRTTTLSGDSCSCGLNLCCIHGCWRCAWILLLIQTVHLLLICLVVVCHILSLRIRLCRYLFSDGNDIMSTAMDYSTIR